MMQMLIRSSSAEVHPRLLRSRTGKRVALQIEDVHAGQADQDAPSSVLEFIRSYLDLQGFIHPSHGHVCHTPDLQLCASAVPSLFPASTEVTRTRAKLLCISSFERPASLMSGPILSSVTLMDLRSTCDAFMSVMPESIGESMPAAPASLLASFLASIIQGAQNSGVMPASGLCFDIDAVQRMLELVHADLMLPSIDDAHGLLSGSCRGFPASGSAIMELFGCMLEGEDSEEALARRTVASKGRRLQV